MIRAEGKFFTRGTSPFDFRGLPYEVRGDLSLVEFGERCQEVRAAGFTVVSIPPIDPLFVEVAARHGLAVLLTPVTKQWASLIGASRRRQRDVLRSLAAQLHRDLRGHSAAGGLLGVALGGELAPEVRQGLGRSLMSRIAARLTSVVREQDPDLLVTWVAGWPFDTHCPTFVDYLTVDFDLEQPEDLGAALGAAHRSVGDRPLVIGRVSLGGDPTTPHSLYQDERVADTAIRGGAAGSFAQASTSAAAALYAAMNRRTVRSLDVNWPAVTVVICAFNAASTLEECLAHCDRLDYPALELLVVDDGSTDETPSIVQAHPRVRLLTLPHVGLAAARNAGYKAATGALVAYLDADAYPTLEWVWYLALGALGEGVAGSGGPNVPPRRDPHSAKLVSLSPGGPIPQLCADDKAIHIPGCNMAFWKQVLEELNGFDPVLWSAEDVEFGARVLESYDAVGYHPAALVWHHRRPGIRPYLRQQRNYGRGQALTERRYPQLYPHGLPVRQLVAAVRPHAGERKEEQTYRVAYRSLHWQQRELLDLSHKWGIPLAVLASASAPLALIKPVLGLPAASAAAFITTLFCVDLALAGSGTDIPNDGIRARAYIATCFTLRPLAYRWGKWSEAFALHRRAPEWPPTPAELSRSCGAC